MPSTDDMNRFEYRIQKFLIRQHWLEAHCERCGKTFSYIAVLPGMFPRFCSTNCKRLSEVQKEDEQRTGN